MPVEGCGEGGQDERNEQSELDVLVGHDGNIRNDGMVESA